MIPRFSPSGIALPVAAFQLPITETVVPFSGVAIPDGVNTVVASLIITAAANTLYAASARANITSAAGPDGRYQCFLRLNNSTISSTIATLIVPATTDGESVNLPLVLLPTQNRPIGAGLLELICATGESPVNPLAAGQLTLYTLAPSN